MTTHSTLPQVKSQTVSALSDLVEAIAPTIAPGLIGPQAVSAINAIAQNLPFTLGSTIGFERPLHTAASEADFFLRVSGASGKSFLAGKPENKPVLEQLCPKPDQLPSGCNDLWESPIWQRLRQLAQHWSDPDTLLHQMIEDIWLEFDIDTEIASDRHAEIAAKPSCFVGIRASNLPVFDWVRQAVLPMLIGNQLSSLANDTLQHCFNSIQSPATLFQVGVLSGRVPLSQAETPPIRLYIQNLDLDALKKMLTHLNWSGNQALMMRALLHICGQQGRFSLQVEIQETLSPTIAVECYLPTRADWQQVLSRLVSTGFCVSQLASDLLDYPGYIRAEEQGVSFPTLLKAWSQQLAPYRECLLVKRLAYLKFTAQPAQPLQAKAYLGVSPTWVDSRYLDSATHTHSSLGEESSATGLCKALIQELGYGEIDIDALSPAQRSYKSRCLAQALETMCVGG